MRTFLLFALCSFGLSTNAGGEVSPATISFLATQHAVGIVGGWDAPDGRHPSVVMVTSPLYKDGKEVKGQVEICTGIVVEGCLFTGDHCGYQGEKSEFTVYDTNRPFEDKKGPASRGFESISLGKSGTDRDFRIVKLHHPLPAANALKRTDLATERPKVGSIGEIAGYGNSESYQDGVLWKDRGAGKKRVGFSEINDYGWYDRKTNKIIEGNGIITTRANEIVANGDSGGPLFYKGKLLGTAVMGAPKVHEGNQIDLILAGMLAKDTQYGMYTSIPDMHKEIIAAMDKLGCAQNTETAISERLRRFAEKTLVNGREQKNIDTEFDKVSDEGLNEMRGLLRQVGDLDADTRFRTSLSVSGQVFTYTIRNFQTGDPRARVIVNLADNSPARFEMIRN